MTPTPSSPPESRNTRSKAAKKTAARKSAEQAKAEEELRWERWQKRIISIALSVICLATALNELILTKQPSEVRIVAALSVLGVVPLVGGMKSGTK